MYFKWTLTWEQNYPHPWKFDLHPLQLEHGLRTLCTRTPCALEGIHRHDRWLDPYSTEQMSVLERRCDLTTAHGHYIQGCPNRLLQTSWLARSGKNTHRKICMLGCIHFNLNMEKAKLNLIERNWIKPNNKHTTKKLTNHILLLAKTNRDCNFFFAQTPPPTTTTATTTALQLKNQRSILYAKLRFWLFQFFGGAISECSPLETVLATQQHFVSDNSQTYHTSQAKWNHMQRCNRSEFQRVWSGWPFSVRRNWVPRSMLKIPVSTSLIFNWQGRFFNWNTVVKN